ncbi:D-alanyl-D-alanine carboxypeptidase [Candidatus Saccharibacteria bacterium]|nr:D-alanyl-D-alanine carboxypeptidase [Candidatus Saccharibacteria bacterium]
MEWVLSGILGLGVLLTQPFMSTVPAANHADIPAGSYRPIMRAVPDSYVAEAQAAMIFDRQSQKILYAKNQDKSLPIASLTKLMTAYIILRDHDLNEIVTIPNEVRSVQSDASQILNMQPGEKLRLEDAVQGLLIYSANDLAVGLAVWDSQNQAAFVKKMNDVASELGMKNTVFRNPTGLDELGHVSSAQDMLKLTHIVLSSTTLERIVARSSGSFTTLGGKKYAFPTTNKLLGNPVVIGVKTGYTEQAGQCLITRSKKNGRELLTIVLNSPDRFQETQSMINLSFSQDYE